LVDSGNKVVVIEHNVDIIKQSDWIIEVGPGAGKNGGEIIFTGTPYDSKNSNESIIGKFLN
jgi:excinuclease UvrABC ATPase subunit